MAARTALKGCATVDFEAADEAPVRAEERVYRQSGNGLNKAERNDLEEGFGRQCSNQPAVGSPVFGQPRPASTSTDTPNAAAIARARPL